MASKLVLDTATVVAAVRSSRGAAAKLLVRVLNGDFVSCLSTALALEYEATALRPEHLEAGELSHAEALNLLDALVSVSEPVTPFLKTRPGSPDPNDDLVLEAAINGHAELIVSPNYADLAEPAKSWGISVASAGLLLSQLEPKT